MTATNSTPSTFTLRAGYAASSQIVHKLTDAVKVSSETLRNGTHNIRVAVYVGTSATSGRIVSVIQVKVGDGPTARYSYGSAMVGDLRSLTTANGKLFVLPTSWSRRSQKFARFHGHKLAALLVGGNQLRATLYFDPSAKRVVLGLRVGEGRMASYKYRTLSTVGTAAKFGPVVIG